MTPLSAIEAGSWRLVLVLFFTTVFGEAGGQPPATPPGRTGEFGGQSVDALAAGKHVPTDCSITWADRDGRVYCFKDEDSRRSFLKDPHGNLERARQFAAATDSAATANQMARFRGEDVKAFVDGDIKQLATAGQTSRAGGSRSHGTTSIT
jgi:hypothetical protein